MQKKTKDKRKKKRNRCCDSAIICGISARICPDGLVESLNGKYVFQPSQLSAKRASAYALPTFPYEGKVPETRSVEGGKGTKKRQMKKEKK